MIININKKTSKKCKYHGFLNIDEIYLSHTGRQFCLRCMNKEPSTIDSSNIKKIIYSELKCKTCNEIKSIDNYYKNSTPKNAQCKACEKIRKKEYRKRPEVRKKEYISEMTRFYKRKYGITFEDYDLMFRNQNGVCAICKSPSTKTDHRTKTKQRLHIDHCHRTKKVRGLLCAKCNQGIGFFNDNILLLESCIRYLQHGYIDDKYIQYDSR